MKYQAMLDEIRAEFPGKSIDLFCRRNGDGGAIQISSLDEHTKEFFGEDMKSKTLDEAIASLKERMK